ncbi:MAG: efflux RND transporter periplasmic adaptor subunit [Gammaproteobacteria bacterium]|nr:efflux RND transporter periplasmic adaptor subunit [Gammaproteobacteria bacterium]
MKILHTLILTTLLSSGAYAVVTQWTPQAYAADDHGHDDHGHDKENDEHEDEEHHSDSRDDHEHNEEENHGHEDKDDNHEEHGDIHTDNHDGHDDEHTDIHGDHGHDDEHEDKHEGEDDHGHEEQGHGDGHHDEHEEGRTEINSDAAGAAGIKISKAGSVKIQDALTLTGRIMLNRNTTAEVRARFSGVVQSVKANWGDKVKKGQPLATIEANESLRVYTINAPTDGVILTRNTNTGSVAGEEPLFTVADLSEVWAEFHVFPRDLGKVKEGQHVRVHTLDNGNEIEAPIMLILPTADPLSQTVVVIVSIPNKDGKWRPGMTVEGDVHLSEKQVKLAVAEAAVQRMENETVIFIKEGEAYEMRPVKLGKGDGKNIEVLEGLASGEEYVSQGSFIVKADIGKAAAKHEH